MKINWWRVAAYALLALSVGNSLLGGDPLYVLASLVSYGIVRLEWFISTLTEAKNADEDQDETPGQEYS